MAYSRRQSSVGVRGRCSPRTIDPIRRNPTSRVARSSTVPSRTSSSSPPPPPPPPPEPVRLRYCIEYYGATWRTSVGLTVVVALCVTCWPAVDNAKHIHGGRRRRPPTACWLHHRAPSAVAAATTTRHGTARLGSVKQRFASHLHKNMCMTGRYGWSERYGIILWWVCHVHRSRMICNVSSKYNETTTTTKHNMCAAAPSIVGRTNLIRM